MTQIPCAPLAALCVLVCSATVFAQDVYVDANATLSGHGTSRSPYTEGQLWNAIQALDAGETLFVKGTFHSTLSFVGKQQIAVRPWPNDPTPVVIAGGMPIGVSEAYPFDLSPVPSNYLQKGISLVDCDQVTIDGEQHGHFVIEGIAGIGVYGDDCNHVTLHRVTVQWTAESAIKFGNSSITPSRNQCVPPTLPAANVGLTIADCRIDQVNLGCGVPPGALRYKTEAVSVEHYDGCDIHHNHLSNSMMEGIDLKIGASGRVHHNLVEYVRGSGIYANEADDTDIDHNVVRGVGFYQPARVVLTAARGAAPRLVRSDDWANRQPGHWARAPWRNPLPNDVGTGIVVAVGDLPAGGGSWLESGVAQNVRVYQNEVSDTLSPSISVFSFWRQYTGCGCGVLHNIVVANNVCFRAHLSSSVAGPGAISLDLAMDASCKVVDNVIAGSRYYGISAIDQPNPGCGTLAMVIDYNLFWANQPADVRNPNTPLLPNNLLCGALQGLCDPHFASLPTSIGAAASFALMMPSPAINAGLPLQLPGLSYLGAPDLGAHEWGLPTWTAGNLP